MLIPLISFVGLNLVLVIGSGFSKALVFLVFMAEYGYLYVVQATTRSGETLTCSIGDVKEFCTELSQEMRSNRKATMKLLFDKATDVARK
ncbi:hypothetical protein QYM36_012930, partial [Artemia franciscana]